MRLGRGEGLGDFLEPGLVVGVEEGCQALEDSLLVGVEPLALVVGEHLHEDGRGQDGTEGQVLEGVVGTEGDAFGGGNDEEGVFVAHTMTAFDCMRNWWRSMASCADMN